MRLWLAGLSGVVTVVIAQSAVAGPGSRASDPPLALAHASSAEAQASSTLLSAARGEAEPDFRPPRHSSTPGPEPDRYPDSEELTAVVQRYCVACHNDRMLNGNLSLQAFDVARAAEMAETGEKIVAKLRLGMMPPPGIPRPGGDTLTVLVETLEGVLDEASSTSPNPGRRPFQRLNRAEYVQSIRELLGLEIDPEAYLPPDTKSENFDNIADVQAPSATVMNSYLSAASEISRLAIGDANAPPRDVIYRIPRIASQLFHIDGAPWGTRGGVSVLHTFPADGEYTFSALFHVTITGTFFGKWMRDQQLEIAIDGERVALLEVDRFLHESDPEGATHSTPPVFVAAGQRRVSAAFVPTFEGPIEDIIAPIRQSLATPQAGYNDGQTNLPHLYEFVIRGPRRVTGVSETEPRRRIFTCRPMSTIEARPCAQELITRLATDAYRRPLTDQDLMPLMSFWEEGMGQGGFEEGIRRALAGILARPDFLFRFEPMPAGGSRAKSYRIDDLSLASRLSFFLWGGPPDRQLLDIAYRGNLSRPDVLESQVRRMLQHPRAEALSRRFGAQWLRLQDVEKVDPASDKWPNFDRTLRQAMVRETELFFNSIVREDRNVLDLLTADYTFVNEALAKHYDIPHVAGDYFRRVQLTNSRRRGLLGQGSILVQTSHPNRTSPVLRGKWIMEVLLNSPPPPPPPNVPSFERTESVDEGAEGGRVRTVKERMQLHTANPMCKSCHQFIDPLGVALENFAVTGEWRINDAGNPIDPSGTFWDGTPLSGPDDLREALLTYRVPFLRTFTNNLLSYAIGRRVEHFDQPSVREITRKAASNQYRLSSFIVGVVRSDAFRMANYPSAAASGEQRR